jgi:hypothetical protein
MFGGELVVQSHGCSFNDHGIREDHYFLRDIKKTLRDKMASVHFLVRGSGEGSFSPGVVRYPRGFFTLAAYIVSSRDPNGVPGV